MFKANVIGLDQFRKQLATASNNLKTEVAAEVRISAMEFESLAKRSASDFGDRGTLRQSIGHRQTGPLTYEVFVGTFYAPFIEFGTKTKVQVPSGLEDVAAQFRGLKGTGALSLTEAIKGWVKRKGIAKGDELDRVAFVIARSIYRNGIKARPFFYKHTATVRTNLTNRIKNILSGI